MNFQKHRVRLALKSAAFLALVALGLAYLSVIASQSEVIALAGLMWSG